MRQIASGRRSGSGGIKAKLHRNNGRPTHVAEEPDIRTHDQQLSTRAYKTSDSLRSVASRHDTLRTTRSSVNHKTTQAHQHPQTPTHTHTLASCQPLGTQFANTTSHETTAAPHTASHPCIKLGIARRQNTARAPSHLRQGKIPHWPADGGGCRHDTAFHY